ncbi:MAG: cystathionine gamma-lyase [Chloroflexota bacterium]
MRDATRVLRAGLPDAVQGEPFLPGPAFASTFHLEGDPASSAYSYRRYHNPSWTHFERALSDLEGGHAVVFPSGMAAISALFAVTLRPGDVLVMPSDGYYTARGLAEDYLRAQGIEVRLVPTRNGADGEDLRGATLILIETPSNPGLDVCDIALLAARGHDAGSLVAVDNTTATALGQRPLELGADISIASDTKMLCGHGDIVLGHVATKQVEWAEKLAAWRTRSGCIPGPMEVWLAHRSLATLDVRMERQCRNALAVASFLKAHPRVHGVRYPGLPGDPAHELATRQMTWCGPVIGFALEDRAQAERFLNSCALVSQATSFGGVRTSAERRARWGGDAISEAFIRLSVGCEDAGDLIDDVSRALQA